MILLGCSARAEAPHDLFTLALNRIDSVYLWRNTLDPVDAFSAAGRQLEAEVEWAIGRQGGPRR